MSNLTLHTTQGHSAAFAPLVVAQLNQVALKLNFLASKDLKSADFVAKSPLSSVPVLETPEGSIFEAQAICRYLARMQPSTNLLGQSFHEQAEVDLWLSFCASELNLALTVLTAPVIGHCKSLGEPEKQLQLIPKPLLKFLTSTFNSEPSS